MADVDNFRKRIGGVQEEVAMAELRRAVPEFPAVDIEEQRVAKCGDVGGAVQQRRDLRPEIQIFASDLDAGALATGREGRYPAAISADVSEERLRRFFTREGEHYRIRREVRDIIVFAAHSLLKDPPFSRIDLISCRNLLIYLDRDLQQQACSIFHYALSPGGFLLCPSFLLISRKFIGEHVQRKREVLVWLKKS